MQTDLYFIGRIETPYTDLRQCPSFVSPGGPECRLELKPEYAEGIMTLEEGEEILVLYWLGEATRDLLIQSAFGDPQNRPRGTFSLRSPHRPNPIGAAVVTIEKVEGRSLVVRGLDCLDGTPLLDIKPAAGPERNLNP